MNAQQANVGDQLAHVETLIHETRLQLDAGHWEEAAGLSAQAVELDPENALPYQLLAESHERMGHEAEAAKYRDVAKAKREAQWKRNVEAEIRGRHELMGGVVRHEIP